MNEEKCLLQELRSIVDYDEKTGVFTWKANRGGKAKKGAEAGYTDQKGYRRIGLFGVIYYAHRVAWLLVYGTWPDQGLEIDHINGDPLDNRIANLRAVSRSVNQQNQAISPRNSKSGLIGASWNKGKKKWKAQIKQDGKKIFLGYHSTREEAHLAYLLAKSSLHAGFVPDRFNQTTTSSPIA